MTAPITPVPTLEDVKQAVGDSYEAFERWHADQTEENWAAYQFANNRAASLNADRLHATLMEVLA